MYAYSKYMLITSMLITRVFCVDTNTKVSVSFITFIAY